jgi:hypothetical protein
MFEIQFQGVITHARVASSMDGATRQIAVLYNVPAVKHIPLITIRDRDVDPMWPITIDPVGTGVGVKCYLLDGELTMNLPDGLPTQYLDNVPHLTDLTNGRTPRASIGNRDPDPAFSAYVTLQKGAMHQADWFDQKAQFGQSAPACIPRTISYAAIPILDRVTLTMTSERENDDFKETYFVLLPNARVRISNLEVAADPGIGHFDTYRNFFAEPNVNIETPLETTEPCEVLITAAPMPSCYRNTHLSVECSNTLYP